MLSYRFFARKAKSLFSKKDNAFFWFLLHVLILFTIFSESVNSISEVFQAEFLLWGRGMLQSCQAALAECCLTKSWSQKSKLKGLPKKFWSGRSTELLLFVILNLVHLCKEEQFHQSEATRCGQLASFWSNNPCHNGERRWKANLGTRKKQPDHNGSWKHKESNVQLLEVSGGSTYSQSPSQGWGFHICKGFAWVGVLLRWSGVIPYVGAFLRLGNWSCLFS